MKPFYPLLLLVLLSPLSFFSQITFYTEDFGTGCGTGTLASSYVSPTGGWTITSTGSNGDTANEWYVSAEENGNDEGECGSGCGNDRSLHLGSTILGDIGAAYYDCAMLCDFLGYGETDKRVESPAINCGGMSAITLEFLYLEGGNTIDNATLWYFDGTTWSQLVDLAKTSLSCAPQGTWTAYSIAMPASAQNNPDVKIGFRWINNDDGDAADPSFAVDDISMTGTFGEDVFPPEIICPDDLTEELQSEFGCIAFVNDYTLDAIVSDDIDPFPMIEQFPEPGEVVTESTLITLIATDMAGNSAECSFMLEVIDLEDPEITCPENIVISVPPGETEGFVTVPSPDVNDCSDVTVENDYNDTADASDTYPLGTTTITFSATDESGNTSDCTFTVTVQENDQECCLGDFNCDGVVSVDDLIIIVTQYGCTSACTADLDGDTIISFTDMQIFTSLYGNICPE